MGIGGSVLFSTLRGESKQNRKKSNEYFTAAIDRYNNSCTHYLERSYLLRPRATDTFRCGQHLVRYAFDGTNRCNFCSDHDDTLY